MAKTIKSPIATYTGTQHIGGVTLDFRDGKAEVGVLTAPVEAYLKRRGYETSGRNDKGATDADADAKAKAKAATDAKADADAKAKAATDAKAKADADGGGVL